MSLRVRTQQVFYLECDRCHREAPAGLMPIEAELNARKAGWSASPDLKGHRCAEFCTPREAPVETPLGEQIDQGFEVDLEGL